MAKLDDELDIMARMGLKVTRRDGTVEDLGWREMTEEQRRYLLSLPSCREWVKAKLKELRHG